MLRRFLLALLLVALPSLPALAADVLINNGLAPPAPANVINHSSYSADRLWIRNVGCPPGGAVWDACPAPGGATDVAMVNGGQALALLAYDTSHIEMSGGTIIAGELGAYGSATATLSGGVASQELYTYDNAVITIYGGQVVRDVLSFFSSRIEIHSGTLSDDVVALMNSQIDVWGAAVSGGYYAADAATITIYGGDFRVDGVLVAFGDLQVNSGQATGQLTGLLGTGDVVDNYFDISGTGTIVLVSGCPDADGDGYGVVPNPLCVAYPLVDCDDTDANVFPGHAEICDGKDNDCDGNIDEGFPPEIDADNDGYSLGQGCLLPGNDCDDGDPLNFPGNPEVCDGKDNDCSLVPDDGLDPDLDMDGYTSAIGCLLPGNDCNDMDADIYPGNPEVCDGKDNDCNLSVDEGFDSDLDSDGYSSTAGCLLPGNDCNDADPDVFPGNPEVCDGLDNDCSLVVDDGLDLDFDADGYTSAPGCLLPGTDCDDDDPGIFPGNPEICDGKDNDCDGQIDQGQVCASAVPATSPMGFVALATLLTGAGLLLGLRRVEDV